MTFREAIRAAVHAAMWEASKRGRTLKQEIEIKVAGAGGPCLRVGFGDHDWRHVTYVPPPGDQSQKDRKKPYGLDEAVDLFCTAVLGPPPPAQQQAADRAASAAALREARFAAARGHPLPGHAPPAEEGEA